MRGYACVALDNPKSAANVGAVCRAAHIYKCALIAISGQRFKRLQRNSTNTTKAERHMPILECTDVFDVLPFDCVPIAVDLLPDAVPLPTFKHPERAFYIFGAEDATLGQSIISRCKYIIMVPTWHCMNLSAAVNVVLYDRLAKSYHQ